MYTVYQNDEVVFQGSGKTAMAIFSALSGAVRIVNSMGCTVIGIS